MHELALNEREAFGATARNPLLVVEPDLALAGRLTLSGVDRLVEKWRVDSAPLWHMRPHVGLK